jgi:hypothetical protein
MTNEPGTPLIGQELRPQLRSDAQDGPWAPPGARTDTLRALAAGELSGDGRELSLGLGLAIDGAVSVSVRGDVLEAPIEGELVLLDPVAGTYFGMNETAAAIWGLLREGRSVAQAAGELCARFEVEPGRAHTDVERLVARLVAAGLVRARTGDTSPDVA